MKFLSRVFVAAAVVAFATSIVAAYAASPPPSPAPGEPRNLKAVVGDQTVTLTWSAPSSGTAVATYTVTASPGNYTPTTDPSTTRTVPGLTNGTQYTFGVFATDMNGVTGRPNSIKATPHVFPPGAPTNLGATPGPGAGQITVSWTPPASAGSPLTTIAHYNLTVSPGGISYQTPDANTTTYVAENTAANITYTFSVSATNTEGATGPAATVFAPLPSGASIGLDPTAGGPTTSITATGQAFLNKESITLYWDDPSHVAASVVTDGTGTFTQPVKPFAGDKPKVHKLCASVPPNPCANFTLQGPPTPTPPQPTPPPDSPSASPSSGTVPASAARTSGGGGLNGLDVITRPPFVFLPILAIIGLIGLIAFWVLSGRRQPPAPVAASVTHLATRPDYMSQFPTAAGSPGSAAVAPPPPPLPVAEPPLQTPVQPPPTAAEIPPVASPEPLQPRQPAAPPAPVEWPAAPTWPAAPDEPPDLPEPSD